MADYWKSNPRKFCDVCKCWFADNRASVDFHEGGQRHKANVIKQLEQARKNFAEKEREKRSIAKQMDAIEAAAFNAYQRDMSGAPAKKAKMPVPGMEETRQVQDYLANELATLERESEKRKIEAKAKLKIQELQTEAALKTAANNAVMLSWQQCYSPEGHVYYYNTATGVSQWDLPENFQLQSVPPPPPPPLPCPAPETSTPTTGISSSVSSTQGSLKRSSDKAELEERDTNQKPRPKRATPYGSWTTVSITEKDTTECDANTTGDNKNEAKEEEDAALRGTQFQEKTLSVGLDSDDDRKGEDGIKGFSFKKRTNKKRPQSRQRTSDVI